MYANMRSFAFFVVNFGYTKTDYNQLTELEKSFIYKAYETREVHFFTFLRNAMYNALVNSKRRKNKRFVELFKKKQPKVDKNFNKTATQTILAVEEKEGKSWVDKVYAKLGKKKPLKKGE